MKIYENDQLFLVIGHVYRELLNGEIHSSTRFHLVMAENEKVAEDNFRHHYESGILGYVFRCDNVDVVTTIGNP